MTRVRAFALTAVTVIAVAYVIAVGTVVVHFVRKFW